MSTIITALPYKLKYLTQHNCNTEPQSTPPHIIDLHTFYSLLSPTVCGVLLSLLFGIILCHRSLCGVCILPLEHSTC